MKLYHSHKLLQDIFWTKSVQCFKESKSV